MAARFQRLDNSEDITSPPERSYASNYYDEPQNVYFDDNRKRMSSTTRKPVPVSSPPVPYSQITTPEEPFLNNQFNSPRFNDKSSTPSENQNPFSDSKPSRSSVVAKTASRIWAGVRGQHVSHVATPLWAAPWRHQPCPDLGGAKASTVREFDRVKQRNRIFFHFFIQWLVPVAFCVAIAVVFYVYSSKTIVTRQEKYIFNALFLGLSLCLGFAVVNGMKEYMNILRWRLLARRYRSLQEFETLLGISSQRKALRLVWMARTDGSILPNGTQLLCFCYLLLMLTMQVVIALLGLTQSVETATDKVNVIRGNVSIADLSFFKQVDTFNDIDPYQLQSGVINSYGITGTIFPFLVKGSVSSYQQQPFAAHSLVTDNKTEWRYYFTDSCPEPECRNAYITNRFVSAVATCRMMPVLAGGFEDSEFITFTNRTGQRQTINYQGVATATTTWMSNEEESCGKRCTSAYAINIGLKTVDNKQVVDAPQIFQCNNTVSAIYNYPNLTSASAYQLPDDQARLVAGAIGYNGISFLDSTYQRRTYDGASFWSWSRNNNVPQTATDVANNMMRFSVDSIAAIDGLGHRVTVDGYTPVPAQVVEIKWFWAILILALVPAVQLLVLLIVVVWGNAAVIQDGSYLSTAALLRPVIERLERTGCALTSDEICEVLGNPGVAYGVREPPIHAGYAGGGMMNGTDDVKHLDIKFAEEDNKAYDMAWRIGMKMPVGRYDGVKQE